MRFPRSSSYQAWRVEVYINLDNHRKAKCTKDFLAIRAPPNAALECRSLISTPLFSRCSREQPDKLGLVDGLLAPRHGSVRRWYSNRIIAGSKNEGYATRREDLCDGVHRLVSKVDVEDRTVEPVRVIVD